MARKSFDEKTSLQDVNQNKKLINEQTLTENAAAKDNQPIEMYNRGLVIIYALLAAFGSINFGYSLSFSAHMSGILTKLGFLRPADITYYTSLLLLGAMVGSIFCGFLFINTIGRKNSIILSSFIILIGWILQLLLVTQEYYYKPSVKALLFCSRFVVGLGVGSSCAVVPVYVHEISPKGVFPLTSVFHQIFIGLGFAIAKSLSYILDIYDNDSYLIVAYKPYVGTITILPGVIIGLTALQILLGFFIPYSPTFLYNKNKSNGKLTLKIENNNRKLYGTRNQMSNIYSTSDKNDEEEHSLSFIESIKKLKSYGIRTALFTGCGLMFFQQFTGINPIIMNGVALMEAASIAKPTMGLMLFGIAMLVGSIMSAVTNTYFGRKSILIVTSLSMCFCHLSLAIQQAMFKDQTSSWTNWISVILLFIFLVCFTIGWGPIPFIMNSQIYPHSVVGFCSGIATMMTWLFGFIITICYKSLLDILTLPGMFGLFSAISFLAFVFTILFVPEVRNLSPHQITSLFDQSLFHFNFKLRHRSIKLAHRLKRNLDSMD